MGEWGRDIGMRGGDDLGNCLGDCWGEGNCLGEKCWGGEVLGGKVLTLP